MKPKKSVIDAVQVLSTGIPHYKKFPLMDLHCNVIRLIDKMCYPDTTRHAMTTLRTRGVLNYECVDRAKSVYMFIPVVV